MRRLLALITTGVFAMSLAAPPVAAAPGRIAQVPLPNGVDDTTGIQAALDWCVGHGPGCTVQLRAGTYLTRQLVAYDFRGTFRGAGRNSTTIEALPGLVVTIPDAQTEGSCRPNTTDCRYPTLITFVDGDIHVADLAIRVTATDGTATTPWRMHGATFTSLIDAVRIMGRRRTDVTIDRIAIEGRPDASETSFYGMNLVNGIIYTGELPRSSTPLDFYTLSGSLTVRSSSFRSMFDGVSQDGFLSSSRITIGGSPSAGNRFEDVLAGIDLETAEGSSFDVSYNVSSAVFDSMWVVPWAPEFVPRSPSHYEIHDNTFMTEPDAPPWAQGILLYQDPASPWIQATIRDNTIVVQAPLNEGIDVNWTKATVIAHNTIIGEGGYAAISLWGSTASTVVRNDVSGFVLDPTEGFAQVYLDPATSHDRVICLGPADTVLDDGTANVVIGCAGAAGAGAGRAEGLAPTASGRPRSPWTSKPRFP